MIVVLFDFNLLGNPMNSLDTCGHRNDESLQRRLGCRSRSCQNQTTQDIFGDDRDHADSAKFGPDGGPVHDPGRFAHKEVINTK